LAFLSAWSFFVGASDFLSAGCGGFFGGFALLICQTPVAFHSVPHVPDFFFVMQR